MAQMAVLDGNLHNTHFNKKMQYRNSKKVHM